MLRQRRVTNDLFQFLIVLITQVPHSATKQPQIFFQRFKYISFSSKQIVQLETMAGKRGVQVVGLGVAGLAGYYLYAAGGSPKVAEKQFERMYIFFPNAHCKFVYLNGLDDATKLGNKISRDLPGTKDEAKSGAKLNAEQAGQQFDKAVSNIVISSIFVIPSYSILTTRVTRRRKPRQLPTKSTASWRATAPALNRKSILQERRSPKMPQLPWTSLTRMSSRALLRPRVGFQVGFKGVMR
jgi:hypothetical protein